MAGLALYAAARGAGRWRRIGMLLFACWPGYVVFQIGSRAGALALIAAVLLVAVCVLRRARISRRRLLAAAVLALALGAVVLPRTSLYARMTGDSRFAVNSAAGTTSARELAWRAVLGYVDDSPSRIAIGVGPGPDYLVASGARVYFGSVHQGDIRVPHDVLLTYYARLGLVGLALFGWWLVTWARACLAAIRDERRDELSVALILVTATILLTSLVGVVLESPFGAVPFFWASGLLVGSWQRQQSVAAGV
jgi:O-antigen ligase